MDRKNAKEGFAMTKRTTPHIGFTTCKRRQIQSDFTGVDITSDGGWGLLLKKMDRRIGVTESVGVRLEALTN